MERLQQITTTPPSIHVAENPTHDEGEDAQMEGTTDFSLEGVENIGSEMERVHITEKNKSMAQKLKVCRHPDTQLPIEILRSLFYRR